MAKKKVKRDPMRFFEDKKLMKEAKLTDEEWDFFETAECDLEYGCGKHWINGGYATIVIDDWEEDEDGNWLTFMMACGTEGESWKDCGRGRYNRDTKKIDEDY